jgi:electron transport complex protein RnfB
MPDAIPNAVAVARIDEATCIGCTLCIQACPTDAIVGAAKLMHTVVADRCTGCGLCLPPCPVDCIAMLPAARRWSSVDAERAHEHASARAARLASGLGNRWREHATQGTPQNLPANVPVDNARERRRAAVAAALARARSRRGPRSATGA